MPVLVDCVVIILYNPEVNRLLTENFSQKFFFLLTSCNSIYGFFPLHALGILCVLYCTYICTVHCTMYVLAPNIVVKSAKYILGDCCH